MFTEQEKELFVEKVKFWQTHPLEWIKVIFGKFSGSHLTETGLSLQQEDATKKWGELLEAKLLLGRGAKLTSRQEELSKKIGMSIMSGTGTGKDHWAAIITYHFLYCFSFPKILATANTGTQLNDVFWSTCSKIMRLAKKTDPDDPESLTILQNIFEFQAEKIFAREYGGKEWFARACTINAKASQEEQGEVLGGRHEDYMLFLVDEASGIPEAVFKPIEGTLTGLLNVVLMIFNPTRSKGFAVRSHEEEKGKWVCLHWDSRDSELVSKESIENLEKYGVDSPTYRIRVLGLPPTSDSNTLIPWDWVEEAIERELEINQSDPIISGCDIGGGGDKSVIATRQGGVVFPLKRFNDKATDRISDWIAGDMDAEDVDVAGIDVIGLGAGVYYDLRKRKYNVRPVESVRKAQDERKFRNVRAAMYWKMRERFENGTISIPRDRDLIDQLREIKFYPDDRNRIEKKRVIKARLGRSPDESDALAISFALEDSLFKKDKKGRGNKINFSGVYLRTQKKA